MLDTRFASFPLDFGPLQKGDTYNKISEAEVHRADVIGWHDLL
jgi:hypothetical protein